MAVEGSVTIVSPQDGAKFDVMKQNQIAYDVVPGPKGDHVHVYVDNKEVGILRQLKGSYTFEALSAGKHAISFKVVNKAHTPIGRQRCVNVSVKSLPAPIVTMADTTTSSPSPAKIGSSSISL